MSYDPNSPDSMFSRILGELKQLKETSGRIEEAVNKTNGRVTGLERWRDVITAKVTAISAATAIFVGLINWAVQRFL